MTLAELSKMIQQAFEKCFAYKPTLTESRGRLVVDGEWAFRPVGKKWLVVRKCPSPIEITGRKHDYVRVYRLPEPTHKVIGAVLTQWALQRIRIWKSA